MSFNQYGDNLTLDDVKRERRNDVAQVDYLFGNKVVGRNRTGLRTVPSSSGDTAAGDRVGDFVDDFSAGRRYEFVKNGATLQWIYYSIVVSF